MWRNSCLSCSWHAVSLYSVWWFCQDAASDAIVYCNMLMFFSYWSDWQRHWLIFSDWISDSCGFWPHLSCYHRNCILIWTLPVFLVPLSCWSSCNIAFVLSQNAWFGKLFSQYVHSGAHLSLSSPVWTGHFSNWCVFFWILLYMHDDVTF